MKNTRLLTVIAVSLLGAAFASAQTTDEIIGKYLNAIGGKDQVGQISSLYMEGTMDAMGNQGTIKITQVNGRGYKEEIDVMGDTGGFLLYRQHRLADLSDDGKLRCGNHV